MTLPLEGLTVIAVEQAVAAPFASSRLADAGAHVVKIERPEGDFARGYDAVAAGQSSYFVWLNRGKDSVTLDLASDEGKTALRTLISKADVLIQNLKPGALTRLGFDPAELARADPRLILCSISGYGETGPMANRKAYDLLIQAESGLCSITGGPSEPSRVGISVVDIATGATAHAAILEALIQRGITGKGSEISISMFDVMADWLTVPLLNHEGGHTPHRVGLAHPSIAPYGVFQPREGPPILISIQSDREWRTLCSDFIGRPDLAQIRALPPMLPGWKTERKPTAPLRRLLPGSTQTPPSSVLLRPASPWPPSMTWTACPVIRICAGSLSTARVDRLPTRRPLPFSRTRRVLTARFPP